MRSFLRRFPAVGELILLALFCTVVVAVRSASAATITVTNTNDSGPGSLRQALADAQDGNTIQFDPALNGQTVILTSGELVINKSITISGPGQSLLAIMRDQQAPGFRIFHVQGSSTILIEGLTISGGYADVGGGIFNESNGGTLIISDSAVIGNRVGQPSPAPSGTPTPAGIGVGIASVSGNGATIIRRSTISNNTANGARGNGGGAGSFFAGSMTFVESTINNNHADESGGGIDGGFGSVNITGSTINGNSAGDSGFCCGFGGGISSRGTLSIQNSTISSNSLNGGGSGGGIYSDMDGGIITNCTINANGIEANTGLELRHTILHGAPIGGSITSLGYNLSSDNGGGFLTSPGDQINTDPLLGPLQSNGGPTYTHALLKGSPAIDAGDPNFPPPPFTDQRGYPRVYNGRIDIGSFEAQPIPTPTPTPTPSPSTAQLGNISTRLRVETGDNIGIGGFIINGAGDLQIAIRGLGPSLGQVGLPDYLPDPIIELRDSSGALLASNDDWQDDPTQVAQLIKLGLAPTDPVESALIRTLQPGAYTATIAGKSGQTGVGLVEVYNVDQSVPVAAIELTNISTRGVVQTGDNVMIGGFILTGNGNSGIAVRGIGPSLAQFGVPDFLADPTLELRDSNGTLLISNDNWQDDPTQAAQLTAHGLALSNPNESGIFTPLPPGSFTAILAGTNGGTGVGLVEVYNLN